MYFKIGDRCLIIACIILCFPFNSILPLHRHATTDNYEYTNLTKSCNLVERSKKLVYNLDNTIRKIKDTTQVLGKNIYDHINIGIKNFANKNPINDDEIRQYEQMVIMKKYPYLDLRELEMKYRPISSKNVRHSAKLYVDRNFQHEPSICEAPEGQINVEITNRGLSGFAVPVHLSKNTMEGNKLENNMKTAVNPEYLPTEKKIDHSGLEFQNQN